MEENNQNTFIKIAIGVLLTVALITAVMLLFNKAKPTVDKASGQLDTITKQMETLEFQAYDGTTVSGSEVISSINTKASNNITITVKTNNNSAGKSYTSASYNITNVSDSNYIEPTGKFSATIDKTANETITGVTFVQQ